MHEDGTSKSKENNDTFMGCPVEKDLKKDGAKKSTHTYLDTEDDDNVEGVVGAEHTTMMVGVDPVYETRSLPMISPRVSPRSLARMVVHDIAALGFEMPKIIVPNLEEGEIATSSVNATKSKKKRNNKAGKSKAQNSP